MIPGQVSNNIMVVKTFSSTSLRLAPLNSNKRDISYREVSKAKIILKFIFKNFTKVFTIFCVGFCGRFFINALLAPPALQGGGPRPAKQGGVNVSTDYLHNIPIGFYFTFAVIIVGIIE
jgi:hypothetical protein